MNTLSRSGDSCKLYFRILWVTVIKNSRKFPDLPQIIGSEEKGRMCARLILEKQRKQLF